MIDKLRLNSCRKTLIGGTLMKGVSGGERKRTSIGYELIKNPSILMLDEPTSGLDSFTALEIAKILKIEAFRGMTIISTIHCPSSAVLEKFDQLIILTDGYTIYNAPPREIPEYFLRYDL
jgi:ABC-type multidrug transport system ATPase subunit